MTRDALVWRRGLLALCILGLLAVGENIWASYTLFGDVFGGAVNVPGTTAPFVDTVSAIVPGSLASRSNIRVGDQIELRRMTPAERYWERNNLLYGRPIRLPILRNGAETSVVVTPMRYVDIPFWQSPQGLLSWAFWLGSIFSLLVAALLSWRRPDSAEVRTLALTLILIVIGESFFPINGWLTPWAGLDAVLNALGQLLFSAGVALLATYATLFGRPMSALRKVFTFLAYAAAILSALIWTGGAQGSPGPAGVAGVVGLWFGTFDLHFWFQSHPAVLFAFVAGPALLALACALLAWREAHGAERARVAWATGSLAILYLFAIANVQSYFTSVIVYYWILNVSWFVAPLGLTYALLSRRLLDVGFVLNRATVFAAVSLIVVGLFTLAEWALGGWLHGASRVTNVAVSAALALALGLSLHQIHQRVDRFVDGVFFRKRNEDERALQQFAREAAFITDRDTLLERATAALQTRAGASSVAFLLDDGAGRYGGVDENDPALVTLRASHDVVDLHGVESALKGEFAYPMLARGRLVGALVLGPRANGESYAPDESQAIAQVAHGVGVALDLLVVQADRSNKAVLDAIEALPDAIAEKLRPAPERRR